MRYLLLVQGFHIYICVGFRKPTLRASKSPRCQAMIEMITYPQIICFFSVVWRSLAPQIIAIHNMLDNVKIRSVQRGQQPQLCIYPGSCRNSLVENPKAITLIFVLFFLKVWLHLSMYGRAKSWNMKLQLVHNTSLNLVIDILLWNSHANIVTTKKRTARASHPLYYCSLSVTGAQVDMNIHTLKPAKHSTETGVIYIDGGWYQTMIKQDEALTVSIVLGMFSIVISVEKLRLIGGRFSPWRMDCGYIYCIQFVVKFVREVNLELAYPHNILAV